jgi:hypothetical protein
MPRFIKNNNKWKSRKESNGIEKSRECKENKKG